MELIIGIMVIVFLFVLYFIPAFLAWVRYHQSFAPITIINLFFGWTLVGWVCCLAWASSKVNKEHFEDVMREREQLSNNRGIIAAEESQSGIMKLNADESKEKLPPSYSHGGSWWVLIVILVLVAFIWLISSAGKTSTKLSSTPEQSVEKSAGNRAAIAEQREIVSKAIASLKKKPTWEKIVPWKVHGDSVYVLELVYKEMPSWYRSEVESDTKEVVRSVLKVLITSGADPSKAFITVPADMRERGGETGKKMYRVLGRATYNPDTDKLLFQPDNRIIPDDLDLLLDVIHG